MSVKKEFGDFQTPLALAERVTNLVSKLYDKPDLVVEPTAGLGNFLSAAAEHWDADTRFIGYEVNKAYYDSAKKNLNPSGIEMFHRDFFTEDWKANLSQTGKSRVLVLGNPPWVTNSGLGQLGSSNLPSKSNFQGMRGLDAMTGKSNFDIAEWMLIQLIEALPKEGAIAVLCKTITARKVLRHIWKSGQGLAGSKLFHIDAKAEFDVAVDACFFFATAQPTSDLSAEVYSGLDLEAECKRFGFIDGQLVSDIEAYRTHIHLDGGSSSYVWRSGVKHDASKVMEFDRIGDKLQNGYGEVVDLEKDYLYPLLKSSDIGNGRLEIRKSVLVTQRRTSDPTNEIQYVAPKTWAYLQQHSEVLDARKSSIYRKRPRFCVFGIGDYSFAPWKIAISGLYKKFVFSVVPPMEDKPVMVDDTCYTVPCKTEKEAKLLHELLTSEVATEFMRSLVFIDSKRPITIDVLRRISFVELARELDKMEELEACISNRSKDEANETQMALLMESGDTYGSNKR